MTIERFPIESAHILMFARAINDPNPIYADADHAAGTELGRIPAPPTFVQASAQFDPDYPLRPKFDQPWFGSGREPTGIRRDPAAGDKKGGGGLHAEQHFEYHLPVLAGDVLTATTRAGATWEKQGRRGGALHFSETITEYHNQHGQLVITARGVGVRTGQVVEQEG
jgi:acyl dehydratase